MRGRLAEATAERDGLRLRLSDVEDALDTAQEVSMTGSYRWNTIDGRDAWSRNTYAMLGYDPATDEPSFDKFMARLHPDDRRRIQETAYAAVSVRRPFRIEYRLVRPDGSMRYLQSVGEPDRGVEYQGAVIDVTDLRMAEDALRETQLALVRVSRLTAMGELAASIAHELNQPLTSIIANAAAGKRWLNRQQAEVDRLRASLDAIIKDSMRAGQIIRSLHTLARKSPPTFAPVNITAVIEEVLVVARPQLERMGGILTTNFASNAADLIGNRNQLQQVVLNLINNAIEAMSIVTDRDRVMSVNSRVLPDGYIEVSIADTGLGFEPAAAEHLFEAFYSTKPGGMGMGLSICRSIVEGHMGRLIAESRAPHGSTFRLQLPPGTSPGTRMVAFSSGPR